MQEPLQYNDELFVFAFYLLFLLTGRLIWFHPPLCVIDFIDRCTKWQSIVCCEIIVPSLVLWWDSEFSPYNYSHTWPARVTTKAEKQLWHLFCMVFHFMHTRTHAHNIWPTSNHNKNGLACYALKPFSANTTFLCKLGKLGFSHNTIWM